MFKRAENIALALIVAIALVLTVPSVVRAAGNVVRDTTVTANNSNVHCSGGETCSPDGKWRATVATLRIVADPGHTFVSVPAPHCDGKGCPWCDTPGAFTQSATQASVTIRCWGLPVTYTLVGTET